MLLHLDWSCSVSLSSFDIVQNCLCSLVKEGLVSLCNLFTPYAMLQAYYYFHSKCSDDLHPLVLPLQTFTARTYHSTSKELIHPHFLEIVESHDCSCSEVTLYIEDWMRTYAFSIICLQAFTGWNKNKNWTKSKLF